MALETSKELSAYNIPQGVKKKSWAKKCPGGKIRSKGKGRGLGRGRRKGPVGIPVGIKGIYKK